jgi:hypothetical protein
MLGVDTFTCSYLDEFINNDTDDLICSSGPPYLFIKTDYWAPKNIQFEHNGFIHNDVDFINADVVCINNFYAAEMLYNKSIEFWTGHAEQGGMNYLYQNQESLNIKVSIVDFPYLKLTFYIMLGLKEVLMVVIKCIKENYIVVTIKTQIVEL